MNKVPTAEEFLEEFKATRLLMTMTSKDIQEYAIEFAKLYVEAALKAAHLNQQLPIEDLKFTSDAYPLEKIK